MTELSWHEREKCKSIVIDSKTKTPRQCLCAARDDSGHCYTHTFGYSRRPKVAPPTKVAVISEAKNTRRDTLLEVARMCHKMCYKKLAWELEQMAGESLPRTNEEA